MLTGVDVKIKAFKESPLAGLFNCDIDMVACIAIVVGAIVEIILRLAGVYPITLPGGPSAALALLVFIGGGVLAAVELTRHMMRKMHLLALAGWFMLTKRRQCASQVMDHLNGFMEDELTLDT